MGVEGEGVEAQTFFCFFLPSFSPQSFKLERPPGVNMDGNRTKVYFSDSSASSSASHPNPFMLASVQNENLLDVSVGMLFTSAFTLRSNVVPGGDDALLLPRPLQSSVWKE